MPIASTNPATGETVKTFDELTPEQIEAKIAQAQSTFETWKDTSYDERRKLMLNLAQHLKDNARKYAEYAAIEMGKPINAGIAEVEKCAWVCEYYAENIEEILKKEVIETDASESYVQFDPIGIVVAVMPWNYPYWQAFRFIAPAAMAGNVGLLKHASNVPQCAEAMEEMFDAAGFPKGVFQNMLIGSSKVEVVLRDDRVKAATLTGSEYAGSQVAKVCGEEIKKTVLELGGSDPFIVLSDAEITAACDMASTGRFQNSGQSCIAAKRFIVMEDVLDEFVEKYKAKYESFVVGDPMDENTNFGPLVNEKAVAEVERQVNESVEKGAEIVAGGKRWGDKGAFYEPTIVKGVKKGMPLYDEETFGPAAAIIAVKSEEEAIEVANDTEFGLGASIHTQDTEKAKAMAKKIDAGAVFINSFVKSDPRLPFGGEKKSGIGRELSHYGIKEFCNIKTVWVK